VAWLIFQLNPETVWMQLQYGRKVFFPDVENSEFNLSNDVEDGDTLIVRGTKLESQPSTTIRNPIQSLNDSLSGTPTRPVFSATKKTSHVNVKIVKVAMKQLPPGKMDFNHLSQTFIDITDDTANVNYVTSMIQGKWGSEYSLVTADGPPLEDCSGTTGKMTEFTCV
jgi:hypothetical protein